MFETFRPSTSAQDVQSSFAPSLLSMSCPGMINVMVVVSACFLFTEEDSIPKKMTSIGYGATDEDYYWNSDELREVKLEYVGRKKCKKAYDALVSMC